MKLSEISKQRKIYIIAGIVLPGILLWAFIYASILTHNFNRDDIKGKENKQELTVSDIILTETKEDIKYWEIYGETGKYDSEDKVAILDRVIGNFYKENEVSMSFESQLGTYNEELGQIVLNKDVFIAIKDGTTLKCDKLVWSGSDKDIIATGNVKINRNNELKSDGDKVIISADYSRFKIIGNTKSKLYKEQK